MSILSKFTRAYNIASDWRFSDRTITLGKTDIKRSEAVSVIGKLKLMTEQLTQKDIKAWRTANQAAIFIENPKRYILYTIYDDAMHDLHLKGAVRNRKMAVVGKPFLIKDKAKNKNEDLTELMETRWFKQFLNFAVDSVFYGHSLIELTEIDRTDKLKFNNVELVPRHHVCPEYQVILPYFTDWPDKGIKYRDELADTCIEVCRSRKDLGELNSVSKETISKKYVLQFWDQFAEMFGMPLRVGKTSSRDPKDQAKIENMLDQMGSAAWGLFPEGTSIEMVGNNQGDAYEVYDKRIIRANSEMSKAILGQTMTMDNGSSRSQALVHEDVADDIADEDRDFIRDIVNDTLFPFLIKHGWPLKGFRFDWDDAREYSTKEMMEIEDMILQNYDVDPEYFIDKYGIKIIGKKEVKAPAVDPEADPKGKNTQKKAKLAGSGGFLRIDLHGPFADKINLLYQQGPNLILADGPTHIDELIDRALRSIFGGSTGYVDPDLWKITTDELNKAVNEEYDKRGAIPFKNKLKYQNSVFSAFKSAHQKTTLRHLKEAAKAESYPAFKKQALSITGDYNKTWLKAEYKAVKTRTRSAINYQDALADQDIYPNIKYMPSRAGQPREEHKPYYGTILPINHPWWNTHLPPTTWGCECWWSTSDDQTTPMPGATPDDVSPGLDINPGKTGRLFSNSHPYYSEMDQAAASILKENVAAIHGKSVDDLTVFYGHKETKGCAYSFEKLGKEYALNVDIAWAYAAEGNGIQLFGPRIGSGSIDSRVNGIWNEFKQPGVKSNAIDQGFRKANSQFRKSKLKGDITFNLISVKERGLILDALKGRIERLGNDCFIENVHFVSGDKYLGYSTIKEITNGKLPF